MKKILVILIVLASGIALLIHPPKLLPEKAIRQQTLRQSFAPAGVSASQSGDISVGSDPIYNDPVTPVTIELSEIPPHDGSQNSQYERWQRGEIDLDYNEGIIGTAEIAELQDRAMRFSPSAGIQQAESGPGLQAPTLGVNFDSLDYTDCCGGGGVTPPDPILAAGPNHLIAVVNLAFEIYDKTGATLLGPTTLSSFYSALGGSNCTAGGPFDPNVLYDESTDRWMIAADGRGNAYCVGVSQTNNPLGNWYLYEFPTNVSGYFFDYPHAGVGQDAIYMGANMFSGFSFAESRIWAFDKTAMYAGLPTSSVTYSLGNTTDTPQPLNLHGFNQGTWPTSGPHYILTSRDYNGKTYALYSWNAPFGANTLTQVAVLDIQAHHGVTVGLPVNVVQSGGGTIQANDFRPLDFEYRNGRGWTTMTVSCNPGSGTVNCIQWAEINLNSAAIVQAGVYASNGDHRFFPDLAVNHCGDMALGYTKSNASIFPSVWATGRQSGDTLGTLQAELQIKAGEINYTAFDSQPRRWGDYTEMTIDPDGKTFWYLGEYSKNTGATGRWGNYIGALSYPGCSTTPQVSLQMTVGSDPGVCAVTDSITVPFGSNATYCYEITNTGTVPVNTHTLVDDTLGNILNSFIYTLAPGASAFLTTTAPIFSPTYSTANWTAFNDPVTYIINKNAPYSFIDISATGTPLNLTDDGEANVTLPFAFTFYGVTSNQIRVGNNGGILFNATTGDVVFTNAALPVGTPPMAIFPFWDDLDEETGNVYYHTMGALPNRQFIVQWHQRPHFPGSALSNHITFQVILYENTNEILFQYADVDLGDPLLNFGASATVGLNKNLTTAVQFLFNQALLTNGMAIKWSPTVQTSGSDSATVNLMLNTFLPLITKP
jgi:hypothetical protein